MKNVLITGVAGNIGSALAKGLLARPDYYVVGVDNLSTGGRTKLPQNNPERFRFIKADVNDFREISSIYQSCRFDYVFHFAAVVGVLRTLENPLMVMRDIDGIRNILSLSKNFAVKRVFYSSSSEVYGEPVSLPQNEDETPLNSKLPYAIVKNLAEAYLKSYHLEHELNYTIFRFFNTYGPNQSEDFVVPRFLKTALRNEPITIYGDGSQSRTFCYIDDNTDTLIGCLENDLFVNDILNVGSDVEYSVKELAELILRKVPSSAGIKHLPPLKEGDMTRRKPDNSKMRTVLNRELIPLSEGLDMLLNFYNKTDGSGHQH